MHLVRCSFHLILSCIY